MKLYDVNVTVGFCIEVEAENEKEAIKLAKRDYLDESYMDEVLETEIMSVKDCSED